jgi:hypothetical protein
MVPRWGLMFVFVCLFFIVASIFLSIYIGKQEEFSYYGLATAKVGKKDVWFEATRQGVFSHEGSMVSFEAENVRQEVVLQEVLPEGSSVEVMYRLARPYEAKRFDSVDFWFWSAISGAFSGILLLLSVYWGAYSVRAAYRNREMM